jgi:L-asparagine oxygenase
MDWNPPNATKLRENARRALENDGYLFLPNWLPHVTALSLARTIGSLVDVSALLPGSRIKPIQTLAPLTRKESSGNQYSEMHGLNAFPIHTDLAHWARPPRYLMLRCIAGCPDVKTLLTRKSQILDSIDRNLLKHAIARPRRTSPYGGTCLLPFLFHIGGVEAIRWDSLFLIPVNESAEHLSDFFEDYRHHPPSEEYVTLASRGDTLIIDNWRTMHARSEVPQACTHRRIERAYLSSIYA